jgi:hypothetical protein
MPLTSLSNSGTKRINRPTRANRRSLNNLKAANGPTAPPESLSMIAATITITHVSKIIQATSRPSNMNQASKKHIFFERYAKNLTVSSNVK